LIAQKGQIVDRFDALANQVQVTLTCVISSGNTCNGIKVYRSADNITFEEIGLIPGICGSTSSPVRYDFVDEHPILNKISYYKLAFGSVGFSSVISITIRDLKQNEIRIQPNPAQTQTTIYFSNSSFVNSTLNVVSYTGESLLQQTTTNDFFTIDLSSFPAGIYPIVITDTQTNKHKFKLLVVQH